MDDLISRADAIEAVCRTRCGDKAKGCPAHSCLVIEEFDALLSAEAEPIVIRINKLLRKEDFDKLAEDIKKQRENIICIPCDAEVASAEAEWIPCSERLPEEEKKTYWVCTDTEYQCECRWTNNRFGIGEDEWGWSIFDTPQYTKPIAWMPLPKPYREDGEE